MSATIAAAPVQSAIRPRGRLSIRWTAMVALAIIVLITLCAVFAPLLSPYDPIDGVLGERVRPPGAPGVNGVHWLGTDTLGRDVLSRMLYGSRLSIVIALLAGVGQTALGTSLGLIAGYRRGYWDSILMRIVDIQLTVPFLALAIAVAAVLGSSVQNVIIVLIVTQWVYFARVVRSETLSVRERGYVESARAIGTPDRWILIRHIAPNVANSIIVLATFQIARTILAEATLSYLGLGVQPPTPTWGGMVTDGRNFVSTAWWISTMPGILISLSVLATNLLGNWLRDMLDPKRLREV